MPEGDTIHRAARTLQLAIGGRVVRKFVTVLPLLARVDDQTAIAGRVVERVHAAGKHLLIDLSGLLTLRTHMQMNGSWHLYRPGERWRKRQSDMRVMIETDEWIAIAFNVSSAEFVDGNAIQRHEQLRQLGPDLIAEEFDSDEARRRIRGHDDREIAEVLLNQCVVAGIGNVYKSEILFIRRIHPSALVATLTDEQLDAVVASARKLLRHNVGRVSAGRETRSAAQPGRRLWVYGRGGLPCRRCGTPISMRKPGRDSRVTFWCPACQPGK